MGDRGQIAIQFSNKSRIYLYTHWAGTKIPEMLRSALLRGQPRWDDEEYLARIIFCEMVQHDILGLTPFGIGVSKHGDIEHPVPIVMMESQTIRWEDDSFGNSSDMPTMSFADFSQHIFAWEKEVED